MKKATFIVRIILFFLTFSAFLGSAVFAWVAFVEKTQPIMLYSGRLQSTARLYILDDPDFDGIDPNNNYTEIISAYQFSNLKPGQVFTFKLEVDNVGTIDAYLSVYLEIDSLSNIDLLDVINITYTAPINTNQSLNSMFLFEEELIQKSETYVFFFQIVATEMLGNNLRGQFFTIKNLVVRLDQIRNT